jgi:hypothetical protein
VNVHYSGARSLALQVLRCCGRYAKGIMRLLVLTYILSLSIYCHSSDEAERYAESGIFKTQWQESWKAVHELLEESGSYGGSREAYEEHVQNRKALIEEYLSWDVVKDDVVVLVKEEFTREDLIKLSKFFESDVGQKYLNVEWAISEKFSNIMARRMELMLPALEDEINRYHDKIAENIKKTHNKNGQPEGAEGAPQLP